MTLVDMGSESALIDFLKTEARKLQKAAEAGADSALKRIKAGSPAVALGADVQRKHALAAIAREIGFDSWKQVKDCFEGNSENYGTFLHPKRCRVFWNIWFASYDEAKTVRDEHGGYIIPYKHQFVVVDADYVKALSGPDSLPLWDSIGRDFVRPANSDIRQTLEHKIIRLQFEN